MSAMGAELNYREVSVFADARIDDKNMGRKDSIREDFS